MSSWINKYAEEGHASFINLSVSDIALIEINYTNLTALVN